MAKTKHGLGRGLDALIKPQDYIANGESEKDLKNIVDDDGKQVDVLAKISVEFISSNPYQPRTDFDPEAMREYYFQQLTAQVSRENMDNPAQPVSYAGVKP